MTLLLRAFLLLAALAYGAMPFTGMAMPVGASMQMAAVTATQADEPAHAMHGRMKHDTAKAKHAETASTDADCPHPGKTDRSAHCSACLTLPASIVIADAGSPARSAEAISLVTALHSQPSAPRTPPPRA
ncbi:hypothetical protein ACWKW9_04775 [Rhizobium daejeonense]